MFAKKQKSLKDILHERVKEVLKENMKINYMIIPRRTLLTSEKFFVDINAKYIIDLHSKSESDLFGMQTNLNADKHWFIFNNSLSYEILAKCFSIKYISPEFEEFWWKLEKKDSDFYTLKDEIDEKYNWIWVKLSAKVEEEAENLYKIEQFTRSDFFIKDTFLLIKDTDDDYIFTTAENLTLLNIRTFSFYVRNRKNYRIVVVSNQFFSKYKKKIEDYKNTRVYWLSEIKNPFLITYLCNNMTNLDFWDFNLTYFYGDELNPFKINCSVRYKRDYRIINYDDLNDFDLNLLDWDIITLWGKLSWVVTVTNVKVGRFTYRVLIVRKNWIYFLNFRKVEWIPYTIQELEEKSWLDVDSYIIDEENSNPKVKLDPDRELKHFDIDFPLWYSQQDIDAIFGKLVSSTKWTFWINWKTNSWKSTSLKNMMLKFYEHYREKWVNKNILMIENPIEWFDYYFKQIEVDDEDVEDYKSIIMWIKRADLDMCVFWELRTYDVFGIFNEVSNSLPVVSTFHVWTAESFLSILKYYCDKADLNWRDVFGAVNTSIVQIPLPIEKVERQDADTYKPEDKQELLWDIFSRFRLNEEDLTVEEKEFKAALKEIIDKMFDKWIYPIRSYSDKAKPILFYEILTWDMLWLYLNKQETEFSQIYKYLWYTNNILYKTFLAFIDWKMTFDNVKIDDYSFEVRVETLKKVSVYLDNL